MAQATRRHGIALRILAIPLLAGLPLAPSPARAGTIADLGYRTGLSLQGPGAASTVYFPLPPGSTGARLTLDFTASAALDPHSSITILAEDVPLASLPVARAGQLVELAIPAQLTRDPFLKLSFIADQTIADDKLCYDNDVPSAWLHIAPDTALAATTASTPGIGAFWQLLGTPLTIALPSAPSAGDVETALILTTALVERGVTPFINTDAHATIRIDPTQKAMALGVTAAGTQQLVVPNAGAARALVNADAALTTLAATTATASFTPPPAPATGRIAFGDAGIAPATVAVTSQASLSIPLSLARLPPGQHITSLELNGIGTPLPPGESEIAAVFVGDDVIWGRAFRTTPVLDHVTIALPQRLLADGAPVSLQLTRINGGNPCKRYRPLPFTLTDASAFILADGNPAPERFDGFSPAGNGPLPILTDLPPARLIPAIPLLAQLLGSAHASPSAITLSALATPDRPFLLISNHAAPAVSVAPIVNPAAPVTLVLPNQDTTVTLPEAGQFSILQLVATKAGIPGLWLAPGPPTSLADAALPGDGNVAFYNGTTAPATFDTNLHKVTYNATPLSPLAEILASWKIALFAAFWLLITVLVVLGVVRRRRQ